MKTKNPMTIVNTELARNLPTYISALSTGHRSSPCRQSFSFSPAKERLRPSIPAKMKADQNTPGRTRFISLNPGSMPKLNMRITKKPKRNMESTISLALSSARMSFQASAHMRVRKPNRRPSPRIRSMCSGIPPGQCGRPLPDTPAVHPPGWPPHHTSPGLAGAVSYTHLRAHETKANLVCRLLLEKKKKNKNNKFKHFNSKKSKQTKKKTKHNN